ncbi:type II secretion system protein GspL [Sphaerotilus uruguayifluvii]|uniref:General secretion pathway protein L n=1 Tax=Sphaerotilus uruguayifluvii TaxID=2735897 RepID=A0ABX2G673_9BURK|nr:type II secretion system protein GspL [Leptothrix sp. C29]NRT56904.1 general secretion pathway protein L [Leptothrix sp. C29]
MSLLVIQLPARPRLHPQTRTTAAPAPELAWVLSPDGRTVQSEGRCAAALLPQAGTTVAVCAITDVAFHRLDWPKAPAARLRAALAGLAEEALLDETDTLHLAAAPDAQAGEPGWLAVTDRDWLVAQLALVEGAGRPVDRIVPALWPDTLARGHFHADPLDEPPQPRLSWVDAQGVSTWPLAGSLSRALLPEPLPGDTMWTAEPAAAAPAERWLGQPVQVTGQADLLLAAAQSPWNLRQFELAPRHRGLAQLREAWRRFMTPGWRPVRLGLVGLVAAQIAGLNAWAWLQERELRDRRTEMTQILTRTHPQVRAVLDAPVQMERENEMLRTRAGRAGDGDLETLLQVAASVWPEGRAPQTIAFEPGQLRLGAPGLPPEQLEQMRSTLAPAGWLLDGGGEQVTLGRARTERR